MRILLVDQYGELGGAQRCLIDVAEGFSARGWELHAVCPDGPLLRALEGPCATVTAVPCGPFQSVRKTLRDALRMTRQVFTQAAAIRGIAAQRAIDAVYVNGPRMIPAAALARPGCPLVFHAHSVVTQRAAAALVRAGLAASGATVIASSHFVAHQWQQPSLTVLNGVRDCRRLRKSAGVTVAVLGRISPEKGQLEFVRAISKFGNPSGCRFVIAGATVFGDSVYEQRVRHEAEAAGVECLGWVDDVPAFLASVDILVVPSDETDATPRVILEAFSAGSTVIAFAAGGIPELIRNGRGRNTGSRAVRRSVGPGDKRRAQLAGESRRVGHAGASAMARSLQRGALPE